MIKMNSEIENKMKLCWKLILEQFTEKAQYNSRTEGAGLNCFVMLNNALPDGSNCKYCYAYKDEPLWNRILLCMPDSQKLLEKYNPEKNFLITVQIIPANDPISTVGNIRLFEYDTMKEIDI